MITLRKAEQKDLQIITEIYNEAIKNTTATFDTDPKTAEEQQAWFDHHDGRHPILVAEESGQVAGWASLSEYSARCAYAVTAEASIYIKEGHQGQGTGRRLSEAILKAGKEAGFHSILLRIAEGNEASIKLAEKMGFKHIGVMREVGEKFGRLLDVHLMQLIYE